MKVEFAAACPSGAHVLVLPVTSPDAAAGRFPAGHEAAADLAKRSATAARFGGEAGSILELFVPEAEGARRVLFAGVGAAANGEGTAAEQLGAAVVARLLTSGENRVVIDLTALGLGDPADFAARVGLGAKLRSWRHDIYRTKLPAKAKPSLAELVIVGGGERADAAWARQDAVAEGVAFTRMLVAEPANIIYPESFVERCRELEALGVQIETLDEDQMRAAGMGALLGVSQGSARPARLLVLRWDGTDGAEAEPVAFVGKGVTFDTGGISIKPAAGMEDMKWDMGGAGAVAGAIKALAARKARAHVVGICGLVENMPSGTAQRPGDVVSTMSGQTVEVINTDAEGRLVLCDALTWVQRRFKPKTIVDLATLTGAMIIALGHEYGGLFSNSDDLADQLTAAGRKTGDQLWRMPLGDPYDKLIESQIADMKNVGPRPGGSITAAQFLLRYIEEGVRWAHLDIAGMVWAAKPGLLWDKGATGYGVRLLDRLVADNFEK
ncbi:leucyl aminopeptidase [Sphingomonas oleivorans]|uniref:Probable cytosol aminopeptidase n=1 Tax=Sphingomonas oleivorans TaxID=1735121 RepID=A0A2T5FX25_9SPHN|nr:leucyl aminopeptidase [Sphingomonas oleivorans]PTQ10328.1 leucyl aminopeptidase [Sphingomonas oleivorans]